MDAVPSPRHTGALACLRAVALAGVLLLVPAGSGETSAAIARGLAAAVSICLAGFVMWRTTRSKEVAADVA